MSKSIFSEKYNRFRELLVKARRLADLTQSELSVQLSRPQSYVSKYERGERRLDLIEFLEVAEALQIEPAAFINKLLEEKEEDWLLLSNF